MMHAKLLTATAAAALLIGTQASFAQQANQPAAQPSAKSSQMQEDAASTNKSAMDKSAAMSTGTQAAGSGPTASVSPAQSSAMKNAKLDSATVYRGWRAQELMGQTVHGAKGEDIGEIENIIVNADGRATAVVVESGGFLDIGDSHFRVPFEKVDLTPGKDGVMAPFSEETAQQWGLFDGGEVIWRLPREFRVTELVGDYARLASGAAYGYIDDAVFAKDGKLLGVLVEVNGAGLYGYPYYGYAGGFDPGANYYMVPMETADSAKSAPKIDKEKFTNDAA